MQVERKMKNYCIICHESFTQAMNDISATVCGHTFHDKCLSSWLEKSKTCPLCIRVLNLSNVIPKLFFCANPDASVEDDPEALQLVIDSLQAKLIQAKGAIAHAEQTSDMQAEIITSLEMQIRANETQLSEKTENLAIQRRRLKEVEDESRIANANIDMLLASRDALQFQLAEMKEEMAKQEQVAVKERGAFLAELTDLKQVMWQQTGNLESKLADSMQLAKNARQRMDDLLGELTKLKGQRDELIGELDGKQKVAEARKTYIDALVEFKETSQRQKDLLIAKLAEAQQVAIEQNEEIEILKCICGHATPEQKLQQLEKNNPEFLKMKEKFQTMLQVLDDSNKLQKASTSNCNIRHELPLEASEEALATDTACTQPMKMEHLPSSSVFTTEFDLDSDFKSVPKKAKVLPIASRTRSARLAETSRNTITID